MASLECLVPLADTSESEPESQASTIANTPEAESEPAEAHELTGEGTTDTDATDPTTSDRLTESDKGDYAINWEELEAMYQGTSTCRNDRHEGILPPMTPELHPVPSPPDTMLDEPEGRCQHSAGCISSDRTATSSEPGCPRAGTCHLRKWYTTVKAGRALLSTS